MAIFGSDFENDMKENDKLFGLRHQTTMEEFIAGCAEPTIINLDDKILVSVDSYSELNIPINILTIFMPEVEKHNYKTRLIYADFIAFLEITFKNGKKIYRYKDDECFPLTFKQYVKRESSPIVNWVEKGGKLEDIPNHIEKYIQVLFDINYRLDTEKLIILEGL